MTTTAAVCADCGHELKTPAFTLRKGKRVYTWCKRCTEKRLKASKRGAFMSLGEA